MSAKPEEPISYEVITQEDSDTGDLIIPIPPPLLKTLDWKEGDNVQFDIDDMGRIIVRKV
jgi:hypothetical protein